MGKEIKIFDIKLLECLNSETPKSGMSNDISVDIFQPKCLKNDNSFSEVSVNSLAFRLDR